MKEAREEKFYTSDGVLIAPGLPILNYDFRDDVVVSLSHVEDEHVRGVPTGKRVAWWRTEKGVFDGSRMQSR